MQKQLDLGHDRAPTSNGGEMQATLAVRLAQRDERAIAWLFDHFHHAVFSTAVRHLHDGPTAETATVAFFTRVWKGPGPFTYKSLANQLTALEHELEANGRRRAVRPAPSGVEYAIWLQPAHQEPIGGDWCELTVLSAHELVFSIGDVCGHGVSASKEMAKLRAAFVSDARDMNEPEDRLERANGSAFRYDHASPVTAIVGQLDTQSRVLRFANAGHPPPLMVGPAGQLLLTHAAPDLPLGIFADHTSSSLRVPVIPNTLFVFYTDGVTEHERDPIRGEEHLRLAAAHAYRSPEGDDARTIAAHMGLDASLADDAAIFTIRIAG